MNAPVLVALVAHARSVPSSAREGFADRLGAWRTRADGVVLHTCQRVELYVGSAAGVASPLPGLPAGGRRLHDAEAVTHLVRVVCGLDSAVLGEEQVLHQVRETLARRRAAGPLDCTLHRLFELALRAGRRAHGWYPSPRRSLADVALDAIERRRGRLAGEAVLVVGAGMMGKLAARAAAGRGARVLVTNRGAARAADLAAAVGGRTVRWGGDGCLPPLHGAVVAVSGRWEVGPADLAALAAGGAVVADLSSPSALPAPARGVLAERFLSVDVFSGGPDSRLESGLCDRLDALVSETGREYCRWLRARAGGPTIRELSEAAERRRQAELDRVRRRVPGLSAEDLAAVEQMSRRLVAGLLHHPRRAIHDDETGTMQRAAQELFALRGD